MTHLKSLSFTILPQQIERNPKLARRAKLIERLEEQRKLLADPNFAPTIKRWKKTDQGKELVQQPRNIKPWWKTDASGKLYLTLRFGVRTLEIERGKPAIVVGEQAKLDGVLSILIAAARSGEMDQALEVSRPSRTLSIRKTNETT